METKTYTLKVYAPGINGQWLLIESYTGLSAENRNEFMDEVLTTYELCECIVRLDR